MLQFFSSVLTQKATNHIIYLFPLFIAVADSLLPKTGSILIHDCWKKISQFDQKYLTQEYTTQTKCTMSRCSETNYDASQRASHILCFRRE